MKPHLLTIALVAVLAGCAGCSRSSTAPTPTSPTTPTAPPVATPQVTGIAIQGNALLTAIGETSSLTATATLSDVTTKDVTTAVQWTSTDPSSIYAPFTLTTAVVK